MLLAPAAHAQTYAVVWLPFEEALAEAAQAGTPVLVFVEAPYCTWCKQIDREMFMDEARMAPWRDRFVFTALDVADATHTHRYQGQRFTARDLARHLGASVTPTTIFLAPDGEILARHAAYLPPDDYTALLRYVDTGAYRTQTFEGFLAAPPR